MALSLTSAVAFGANAILVRRAVRYASVGYVANITVFSGPVFFLVLSIITGEIFNLWRFSSQTYVLFAVAGIIHFAFGRTFSYRSIRLIGATRSNSITSMAGIVTVIEAVLVLQETITPMMALGIFLSMSGPVLLTWREKTVNPVRVNVAGGASAALALGRDVDRRTLYVGMLYGSICAFCWGTSPIFIKMALQSGGTSIAGSLIAFTAAAVAISYTLLDRRARAELTTWNPEAFKGALTCGMTTNTAQLLRFIALAYAPAAVVSMTLRTSPVWVLIIAFLVERRTESFSRWVLIGNALLVVGTVLIAM